MHLRELKLLKLIHKNRRKLRHAQLTTLGRHLEATNSMSASHAATDPDEGSGGAIAYVSLLVRLDHFILVSYYEVLYSL